jgi:hypothetical protein
MSEHEEQVALFAWADLMVTQYPELEFMFAIPNGAKLPWRRNSKGKRYSPEAMNLKREGLLPGVPDVMLPCARGIYFGLFVEMKYGTNKPSEAQREVMAYLNKAGYKVAVCYDWEEASRTILWYLRLTKKGDF